MLATLIDGSLVALDAETGRTLWTFDSGLPLLSSSGFTEPAETGASAVFPGTDGSLYSYQHGAETKQVLEVSFGSLDVPQSLASQLAAPKAHFAELMSCKS